RTRRRKRNASKERKVDSPWRDFDNNNASIGSKQLHSVPKNNGTRPCASLPILEPLSSSRKYRSMAVKGPTMRSLVRGTTIGLAHAFACNGGSKGNDSIGKKNR